ncbi:MAG: thioesterase family protein [Clostridia bacterium]|nr:thioesterase family protein [Clostridia bacterium]
MISEGQQADGRYCRYFRLGATEVDLFNRLRLKSLLGFFQETAGDQCEEFGSGWTTLWNGHGLCYVVVRMEVRMDRYPGTGETIRVDTWPENRLRMLFERYGEIFDESGARVGAIVSQWALLDVKARHFVRPDPNIIPMPDTSALAAPFALSRESSVRGAVNGGEKGGDSFGDNGVGVLSRDVSFLRTPVFSDFDYNGHMNNARYAEWITDAFWNALTPEERAFSPAIRRMEIKFRAEIPAEHIDAPIELRGCILPEEKCFSLKGIDRSAAEADSDPSVRETVHFECEGEYYF